MLDACSDYFASFLKNKLLDDKNVVICLPKEIKLWEIQALLSFMYHGEVCISQEGLSDLMKCAEMLKIKGLCGNETTSSIIAKESPVPARDEEHLAEEQNCSSANSDMIEVEANESDCLEFNEQMIKREINISNLYHSLNLSF